MLRGAGVVALGVGAVAGALAACGTFDASVPDDEYREDPAGSDASGPLGEGGTGQSDASVPPGVEDGAPPPPCDPTAELGAPHSIPSLNVFGAHTAYARPAGAYLYFVSDRDTTPGTFENPDIYRARFADRTFTDIVRPQNLSTAGEDVAPSESVDGLTLWQAFGKFETRRLRYTRRERTTEVYPVPQPVSSSPLVAGAVQESDPYLVGSHLYFSSAPAGGTLKSLIYSVDTDATGPVGTPRSLVTPPTAGGSVRYPVVSADEQQMYFVEFVDEKPVGVYRAFRQGNAGPFTSPEPLPQLLPTRSANVTTTGLSADGCDLYLSIRPTGSLLDVRRARRGVP